MCKYLGWQPGAKDSFNSIGVRGPNEVELLVLHRSRNIDIVVFIRGFFFKRRV